MKSEIARVIEETLHLQVASAAPVSGGDINEAFRVDLSDGTRAFVKTNARVSSDLFAAEAHGLAWLAETRAISVPKVLGVSASVLVLEWVAPGRPVSRFDEVFGRKLAALHASGSPAFGLDRDNYIGPLLQRNERCKSFVELFRDQRLRPQMDLGIASGIFDTSLAKQFDCLLERLDALLGPEEAPARLHGDLWSGNYLVGADGEPWLIDPAVYGGHREIDLAMMHLFGGFSARVFEAYEEAFPLARGHADRLALMQLYPLLVHANLFRGGYVARVRSIVSGYL